MAFGLASVEEDRGLDTELEELEIEEVLDVTVVDAKFGLVSEEGAGLDEVMGELERVDKGLVGLMEGVTIVDTEPCTIWTDVWDEGT